MEAYCMKCKTKREIMEPQATFNATRAPVTKGKCGVCGTTLYRIGKTPAHEGLPVPEKVNKRSRKLVACYTQGVRNRICSLNIFTLLRLPRPLRWYHLTSRNKIWAPPSLAGDGAALSIRALFGFVHCGVSKVNNEQGFCGSL